MIVYISQMQLENLKSLVWSLIFVSQGQCPFFVLLAKFKKYRIPDRTKIAVTYVV